MNVFTRIWRYLKALVNGKLDQWEDPELILTVVWNNLNYQTVRTNFHTFGGEMAKQKRYPEVYLGEPEIDFVMLAKAQGIQGSEVREPKDLKAALQRGVDAITAGEPYVLDVRVATVGTGAESTWHQRFKLRG